MEIQTTNLLTITLQQSRLETNFTLIDATLKNINEQLINLTISHDTIVKSTGKNKQDIQKILSKLNNQQTEISNHSKWIKQMNFQFQDQAVQQQSCQKIIEREMNSSENIIGRKDIPEIKKQNKRSDSVKVEMAKEKVTQILKAEVIDKKETPVIAKNAKSALQKTIISLKERLAILQQECEANREPIDQLNRILAQKKQREQQQVQKKMRQLAYKRQSLKKDNTPEQLKPQIQTLNLEAKRRSESNQGKLNDFFDILAGKNLLEQNQKYDAANKEMSKQVQSLKQSFIDKIRSIEAQYKQNQNRLMNIQKTVDVVERNYELLKYDFDRTATGWSRQRTNDTQERGKRDNKLNETRTSNHEFYQQKMVEIFQEMDKLKKEYMQIQNKIENEDVQQIGQLLKNDQSSSKLSNFKLISSLRGDSGQNKKEVNMLRKELNKLRRQFEQFAWGVNTNHGQTKTVIIKPNENKQDWKALSTKIYKLKMQLQAGVRDLQSKIVTNNDMVVVLNQLQVGIEQCKLLIKRKVEQSDYEKGLKQVEARLNNFIMQVYQKEGRQNQNEASLAKQPWFCLSCDNQLKNYSGKVMKSPTNQKLQGKKVNPQSHMVRRYENSRLPSVIK